MNDLINGLLQAYPELEIRICNTLPHIEKSGQFWGSYFEFSRAGKVPTKIPCMRYGGNTMREMVDKFTKDIKGCIQGDTTKPVVYLRSNSFIEMPEYVMIDGGVLTYGD